MSYLRVRLLVEAASAAAGLAASLLTLFRPDWVEFLTGFDPDHHGGSAEWLIAGVLLVIAVAASALGRREWRRICVALGTAP
jgi:hypothetical protein